VNGMNYRLLADMLTGIHVAWVAAVVFGLLLVLVGWALGWKWVRNRWFRSIHLAMIVLVVLRTTVWAECPLTWWERDLRVMAGQKLDEYGLVIFEDDWTVGKILHNSIHPDLPLWVFPPVYATFGLLVVGALWLVPVDWRRQQRSQSVQERQGGDLQLE